MSTSTPTAAVEDALLAELRTYIGQPAGPTRHAQDPVSLPVIRHFVEAIGDENPIYLDEAAAKATGREGIIAPPPMLSTWLMVGYKAHMAAQNGQAPDSAMTRLLNRLSEEGFTGVVATNDEHEYLRELRLGDDLSLEVVISDVMGPKKTGLGLGYFITTTRTYTDQAGEVVARQTFRILRFNPDTTAPAKPAVDVSARPRPFVLQYNEFWFKAANERRLVIQACTACGELRHPPSPSCPSCLSFDWHEVPASGRGTVHSFVTSHHPQAPGFEYPLTVVLVDLDEGTRLVADFVGDASAVRVGLPVEIEWLDHDAQTTLPRFRAIEENN